MRCRSWVIITPPKRDDPIYASERFTVFLPQSGFVQRRRSSAFVGGKRIRRQFLWGRKQALLCDGQQAGPRGRTVGQGAGERKDRAGGIGRRYPARIHYGR